eukprot:1075780-Prymnesium_polylepis.1
MGQGRTGAAQSQSSACGVVGGAPCRVGAAPRWQVEGAERGASFEAGRWRVTFGERAIFGGARPARHSWARTHIGGHPSSHSPRPASA